MKDFNTAQKIAAVIMIILGIILIVNQFINRYDFVL